MKKAIFLTVRTGSSRLHQKALKKIMDVPTIVHLINRLKRSKYSDLIILCTSTLEEDSILCDIAKENGIKSYAGSLKDKLDRWLKAALKYDVDYFVNVDGDDLFCEPELIDLAFNQYEKENHDFVVAKENELVIGAFTLGVKTEALRNICAKKNTDDTEAAWLNFSKMEYFDSTFLQKIPNEYKRPDIRATLDYQEDLMFFKKVINHFHGINNPCYNLRDIIQFLDQNPDIIKINYHKNIDYINNQKKMHQTVY
tara:strand:- start:4913 stop:5674 length:762 start_codon:yes stop_codon:yes gene_type:complete